MPQFVARNVGGEVLVLPSSVEGVRGVDDYLELLDYNVRRLADALR
jgi:hypothetical protein